MIDIIVEFSFDFLSNWFDKIEEKMKVCCITHNSQFKQSSVHPKHKESLKILNKKRKKK